MLILTRTNENRYSRVNLGRLNSSVSFFVNLSFKGLKESL